MNEYYTRDQAMELLGMKSINAFLQLGRKYPEAFVMVNKPKDKQPQYDKVALDRFYQMRQSFKQEKP